MKPVKRMIPLLGLILGIIAFFMALQNYRQSDIIARTRQELGKLKDLDADTTTAYLSASELFPDVPDAQELSEDFIHVFQLYFKNFNYKILRVQRSGSTASVAVRLTTVDGTALARDYTAALLRHTIFELAETSDSDSNPSISIEDRCALLNQLLSTESYSTVKTETSLSLQKEDGTWNILQSDALKDDLTGGLISSLSDPMLLTPAETMDIYLSSIKEMDSDQLANYLQIRSLIGSEESYRRSIAAAMTDQLASHFDYEIISTSISGYAADVLTTITTFDSESILHSYEEELDEYLSTAEAVIDGYEKRVEYSQELLLQKLSSNDLSTSQPVTFHLVNDGISWKLADPGSDLGPALFGAMSEEEPES